MDGGREVGREGGREGGRDGGREGRRERGREGQGGERERETDIGPRGSYTNRRLSK